MYSMPVSIEYKDNEDKIRTLTGYIYPAERSVKLARFMIGLPTDKFVFFSIMKEEHNNFIAIPYDRIIRIDTL